MESQGGLPCLGPLIGPYGQPRFSLQEYSIWSEALPGAEGASALNNDICQRLHWSALTGQALVSAGQLSALASAAWGLHPPALGREALVSAA